MKTFKKHLLPTAYCLLLTSISFSATRYVSLDGNHIPPFISWEDAATNIQIAVDWSNDDDVILVSNGVYSAGGALYGFVTNRVYVDGEITIQSLAGPKKTFGSSQK